ncbi:MAG: glycosyltransferase family 2 protein [Actinomycetota bacterium]
MPAVICLTPIHNEQWILDAFLRSATRWADHVIIADQGSTDRSRAIASGFESAALIENPGSEYNEAFRQRILIEEARRIPGKRLLFALDADEMLSHNWYRSADWQRALSAPPGTVIWAQRVNLYPGLRECWFESGLHPLAYVDDGAEHAGPPIHSVRLPIGDGSQGLRLEQTVLLHFQYIGWEEMKAKQRWYQCWELLNTPELRPIETYRRYHHMDAIPAHARQPVPDEWIDPAQLEQLRGLRPGRRAYWDSQVLGLLDLHGAARFRRLEIWDTDWVQLARGAGLSSPERFADPRDRLTRRVHSWLARTQRPKRRLPTRVTERLLGTVGW